MRKGGHCNSMSDATSLILKLMCLVVKLATCSPPKRSMVLEVNMNLIGGLLVHLHPKEWVLLVALVALHPLEDRMDLHLATSLPSNLLGGLCTRGQRKRRKTLGLPPLHHLHHQRRCHLSVWYLASGILHMKMCDNK